MALNVQNPEPLQKALNQQKIIRAERSKQICDLLVPLIGQDIYADVIAKVGNILIGLPEPILPKRW